MMSLKNSSLIRTQCFINGEWCSADSQKTFAVVNPASADVIAQVADAGAKETLRAIDAASQAQPQWAAMTAKARSRLLRKWFDLVMENQEDLAHILTAEQGKPLSEARTEVAYGASYIEWFSEEAKRIYGDLIAPPSNDKRIVTLKQPLGVVGAITPWNFPSAMLARKIAPALAAGCTVVAKPAAQTPLSALALAALADEAGFPPGVLNIVCGVDAEAIGSALTDSLMVQKITFTGSTAVGKKLMQQCASSVKKMSLELGGNAPFIVFDDADIDAAVAGGIAAKFRNAGQTCVCVNRFYIHEAIYDEFVKKFDHAMSQFVVGNCLDEATTIGPLINSQAIRKVSALVEEAIAGGAKKLRGDEPLPAELADGYFYPPTLLIDVPASAKLCNEEIFGPVAAMLRFSTEDELLSLANGTEFGLAAYFYSQDYSRVWRLAERLEVGMVGVNAGIISSEMAPFGGVKQSGFGREGSRYGIEDYVNIKYVCIGNLN